MNPDSKLLLKEMHRLFAEQKTQIDARFAKSDRKWDARFTDSDRKLEERLSEVDATITKRFDDTDHVLTQRFVESDLNWERRLLDSEIRQSSIFTELEQRQEGRFDRLEQSAGALESWRQESEGAVDDLQLKMTKLTKYRDRSVFDNSMVSTGVISPVPVEQAAARSSAGFMAAQPSGHGVDMSTRADGFGNFAFPIHSPANGTQLIHPTPFHHAIVQENPSHTVPPEPIPTHSNRLPKLNFPAYDGDTTKLWISQAEDYFDMYGVPPNLWVKVAGMHFNGAAKRWIQSLDRPSQSIPWADFCKLLLDRFARDQHETLLRQLFHIHQTTTVTDYVERFATLVDQLKAYSATPDMRSFTTRFVDGLRPDIRLVVTMQRPQNIDTAYALSMLQEEVAVPAKKHEFHKFDSGSSFKGASRTALPLPRPPSQEKTVGDKPVNFALSPGAEDKLSSLRASRRAQGLCDRCNEKWFRGHRCASTISLQAMQEVWDLFNLEDIPESPTAPTEQLFLALSHDASWGSQSARTIQLHGSICGHDIVVLVDSGSSASFLAASLVSQLPQLQHTPMAASVKVANGQIVKCVSAILGCQFSLGIHQFQHDLRVLPLESYDLILGMDWLELYSPMQIHWKAKWLSLPYNGDTIILQGLTTPASSDLVVQLLSVSLQDTTSDSSPAND